MKREVTWSGTGVKWRGRLRAGFKLSRKWVEPVDHYLVATEIGGHRKAIGTVELDTVCVWCFLLFAWTRTFVLFDVDCRTETSVALNRQHCNVPAGVVRQQQTLAALVH